MAGADRTWGGGMELASHFITGPSRCAYLPDERSRIEYEIVAAMEPAEYLERLREGWRRFGRAVFRPRCRTCGECRSMRIDVERFAPDRSMRRLDRRNGPDVALTVHPAKGRADPEVVDLFRHYHSDQHARLGWPDRGGSAAGEIEETLLDNPFPTEEWRYRIGDRLAAVGYVDVLPGAFSAIYCFYDPELRDRSPGTWNILCMIERARAERMEHVYLGYYVEGCRSLRYKERFGPNELLVGDAWRPFRP